MDNPFEIIEARLNSIESLLLNLNNPEKQIESAEPDKLLCIDEAAAFLCLSVATIYTKVSKGELPVMKRSKRLYFSRIELTEYLKQGRKKTNSEIDAEAEAYLKSKRT
jgi:excisionase family DNA binding protein